MNDLRAVIHSERLALVDLDRPRRGGTSGLGAGSDGMIRRPHGRAAFRPESRIFGQTRQDR